MTKIVKEEGGVAPGDNRLMLMGQKIGMLGLLLNLWLHGSKIRESVVLP